jgi:hypothetical protein
LGESLFENFYLEELYIENEKEKEKLDNEKEEKSLIRGEE